MGWLVHPITLLLIACILEFNTSSARGYYNFECQPHEFKCRNGECIDSRYRCDRVPHCPDGDDEDERCRGQQTISEEHCKFNEFRCDNGQCIPMREVCDNIYDCTDYSDEKNCDIEDTNRNIFDKDEIIREYSPHQGSRTIGGNGGVATSAPPRMPSNSIWHRKADEYENYLHLQNLYEKATDRNPCNEQQFRCANNVCIPLKLRCDNFIHCNDLSDEQNCEAYLAQKRLNRTQYSHSHTQTHIRTTERPPLNLWRTTTTFRPTTTTPTTTMTTTTTRRIITTAIPWWKTTEAPPPHHCQPNEFECDHSYCILRDQLCNGNANCNDGTDEKNCTSCRDGAFLCNDGTCIISKLRCDGQTDCADGSDEHNCAATRKRPSDCSVDEFFCDDDCHPNYLRCNNYADCTDGSDEYNCPAYPTTRRPPSYPCPQHTCPNGKCYSETERCDRVNDCDDGSDESNCSYNEPPRSSAGQLNLKTYPDSQIIKERREVIFRCRDEGPLRARVRWTRPGGRQLPAGSSDKNGRLEIPNIRVEDSGQYICEAVGYPRHVPGQQVTVHLTVERFNPLLDRPPTACHQSQATCMNGECIDKSQICDGTPHCSDGSDEHSCSHGRKCHPNQFMCRNSKCVDRIWRCDGENDCGDNSDEESCEPEPSGAPCRYDEFQCKTGHCIPKSFQCDDTNDCIDASDEIGCVSPSAIRPLPPSMLLKRGESLNLTCVGTGNPVPLIVWRLNWGHVPDKCVSKSYSGTGTLYCPDMQQADSGAYSCEIINSKGSHFVTPDTLVTVDVPITGDVCPAGFFNMLARRREECISCFCFGVSKNCKSANLFNFALQPPITSHRVVMVDLNPYGAPTINEAPSANVMSLHHGVQFRASDVQYASRETPYLALPGDYLGNQLKSYGGFLRYEVNFVGNGRPTSSPDVIITGNGMALVHRGYVAPQPNLSNKISVQFTPGNWNKPDGRSATREEIMMVLANTEHILIRLGYIDSTEREVELTNIVMDSAGLQDQGLGAASLVEQCQCPVGYTGDSCESCAPGFERQPGGPWLGRCVPFVPEPCAPGTYGDPRRGIPCRQCPCPQAGSNNFASGCKLGPDGEVTCDCYEGYSGRRCEYCAAGYQGNPLVPGGSCHRIPESVCNSEGTYYPHPNGTCECKPLVVGPRCDMCAPESFNLNSYTYTGCTECFCSGLTKQCSSSSWYRDQIYSNFGRSRAPHGFTLIRDYERPQPTAVSFDEVGDSLQFSPASSTEPLYWNLPAKFLGDKITAYGGKLNYTLSYNPLPGGQMSRNNAPDVVIKSGEEFTIIHYRKAGVSPSQSSSYSVPIIESAWQRVDGQVVNREHLLMALSKIDAIYIKATYTTSTKNAALMQVSLDIATQNNIGTPRAVEVEECRCPVGYIGLSCERCAPGYKRDSEAGLYLGICEPCECNGHSNQCDAETGVCLSCADNTEGENCERCIPGYTGNPSAGTKYDCQPDWQDHDRPTQQPPPDNQQRCRSCNTAGTTSCDNGVCYCKPNVDGTRCDQCRPGTYGLHTSNPDGCSECFCSGKASQCRSASLYRQLIPIDFIKDPPQITDENGVIVDTGNLNHDLSTNQYIYSYPSYTQKYWSLRGSVLGNQLHSYGGELSYNLQVESIGDHVPGPDVILIGNGLKLTWSRPRSEDASAEDYHIRLHEENGWYRIENGQVSTATRSDLMQVLSNLDHILLRATPKIPTARTSLRDVILETAVEHPMPGAQHAVEVELCSCPPEYTGNSCESCAPLHYRDSQFNCVSCPCQEDSTSSCGVDEAGYVVCHCKPGHKGDRCQIFDHGQSERLTVFIEPPKVRDISVGESITLNCEGRLGGRNDDVEVAWYKKNDKMPYNSRDLAGELQINSMVPSDSGIYICRAMNIRTAETVEDQVKVSVNAGGPNLQPIKQQHQNLPIGSSLLLNCTARSLLDSDPVSVTWYRRNDVMPFNYKDEDGFLTVKNLQVEDSGVYVCKVVSSENVETIEKEVVLTVTDPNSSDNRFERTVIDIVPSEDLIMPVGAQVSLHCKANKEYSLQPVPVIWYKRNDYLPYNARIENGWLQIYNLQASDSGVYICRTQTDNPAELVEKEIELTVQDQDSSQSNIHVTITQPSITIIPVGGSLTLTCAGRSALSNSPVGVSWYKKNDDMPYNTRSQNGVLQVYDLKPSDSGVYICKTTVPGANAEDEISIKVEDQKHNNGIVLTISPPKYRIVRNGGAVTITCSAVQNNRPVSVTWSKLNDVMPLTMREKNGVLQLYGLKAADSGVYVCKAYSEDTYDTVEDKVTIEVTDNDNEVIPTTPTPVPDYRTQITVAITPPKITIIPVGGSITLTCKGHLVWNNDPVLVSWYKKNDEMPSDFLENEGVLQLYNLQIYDSGVYICKAVSNQTGKSFEDEVSITITEGSQRTPAKIVSLPNYYTFTEHVPNEIVCEVSGNPTPTVIWTRVDGQMSNDVTTDNTRLIFHSPRQSDRGHYRCQAINPLGTDEKYTQISVEMAEPEPQPLPGDLVYIEPPSYTGVRNDNFRLTCQQTGTQPLVYQWTKDGYPIYPQANIQIAGNFIDIIDARASDSGTYTCTGVDQRSRRNYTSSAIVRILEDGWPQPQPEPTPQPGTNAPVIKRLPEDNNIIQGHDFSLTCEATGSPYPTIKWTKLHESLADNVHPQGNVLRIINARPENRGMYVCIAENSVGSDQSHTIIEIEPRERPTVDIHPPEPQAIYVGNEARLYCRSNGIPEPRVQWRRVDGKPLPIQFREDSPGDAVIDNIKHEDAGDYECVAENDIGKATAVATIRVIEAPSITLIPNEESLRVTEGDELKIICTATGSPSPTVKWENDAGIQTNTTPSVMSVSAPVPEYNQAFLEIYRVDRSHSRTYKCVATNEAGIDERYVIVDVQPRRGDAPDDSDVDYQPYPQPPSQPQLRPTYPPQTTQEDVYIDPPYYTGRRDDNLRLTCNQRSQTPLNIQWTKDGYPIRSQSNVYISGNVIDITGARAQDSGTYTCTGIDPYGRRNYTSSSVVRIVDDGYPQPQPQPQPQPHPYDSPKNMYQAHAGDDVTLTCDLLSTQAPAERIPYLVTRWERVDGRPLPHNSHYERNSLIITGVKEENRGQYRCNALDNRGTVVSSIIAELVLVPIPHITFHPKMPIVVTANENVDIYCEVTGEQPIDVSWHTDNNRPLPPSVRIDGQYLRFVSITPADAGRYYCSASNRYGNTTNMAEVKVNRGNSYEQPHARRHDINEGEDVTLTCDVQAAHEPIRGEIRYEWHREDGRPLPYSAYIQNQILILRAVRKEDEGRYVCESYTTAGNRSPPSYVDLNIKPGIIPSPYLPPTLPPTTHAPPPTPPRDLSLKLDQQHSNLRVGESTNVECYSSDNTYTDVVWERADGSPLPPNMQQIGNRLYINHVSATDAGTYVCKCKTDEGDLYTTSYELEIEASEHEWKPPRVVHAKVGSGAQLNCNPDERAHSPRWSRQYGQMQAGRELSNEQLTLLDVQSNDAGTYICTMITPEGESIDYPTILVVEGAIPHFHQDPISYMAFPTLADSYHKFNFDITFRPEKPNGLLLFNGQQRGSGDYISLSLNDRYPEFRFDFDGKQMIVKSEKPIELNEWHTVRVIRFRRDGYMQVDEQHPVAFPTLAAISPLDLVEDLYIGGVPNWELLPENAIDQNLGFVGCVSRLTLQGKIIELMKEAKFKEGIDACEPCKQNPCKNNGICLESQTETAYTCICAQGWTGHNCNVHGSQCTPGVCGAGRCENTETGLECLCPLNKTGDRCQYIEHLNENSLAFKSNSYATYGTPRASKLNIKLQIRPRSLEDSILLYAAESSLPSGDYFALVLHDQHVELISNTGARLKPVVARSLQPIEVDKWTEIEIARRFGDNILRVGSEPEQRAKSGGLARMLTIKTPLYVGGFDKESIQLNHDINITRGFDGCISKLYEGRRQINLLADIQDAANILNCGELNEIDHTEPSDNYERPQQPPSQPETEHQDACASDPCENGGTCSLDSAKMAVCDCPVGFTGRHCEEHITLEFGAKFYGNGYLELNRSQFDENIEQKYSFAALVFSTTDPNGVLLWWGQPKGVEFTGQDFMALGLVDGIVEFSFRLNGAETVIRNPDKRVDDGKRHVVLIKRTDNTAMLELDHLLDAGEATPTGKNTMSLPGHVFIGGTPDVAKFTGQRYLKNFTGCVHVVEGETSGTIPLGRVAISGVNVDTCPQDDPLGGTEPPVV